MSLTFGRPELVRLFLKSQAKYERLLAYELRKFLERQAVAVAARVHRESTIPPDYLVFDTEAEHRRLIQAARPFCYAAAEDGATAELQRRRRRRGGKSPADDFRLSPVVEDAINLELRESFASVAWRGITQTTRDFIRDRLQLGIENRESPSEVAADLHGKLTGMSRPRAKAIARTESGGALNGGHHVARQSLADLGLVVSQEWLAIGDDDVREAHEALDGTTAPPKGNFIVGGYPAPYPCHHSLPAEQRVNCRCTTVANFDDELEDDGEDDDGEDW